MKEYSLSDIIDFGKNKGKSIIMFINSKYMDYLLTNKIIRLDKKANIYYKEKLLNRNSKNNDAHYDQISDWATIKGH